MSTISTAQKPPVAERRSTDGPPSHQAINRLTIVLSRIAFVLFIFLNGVLFIRPSDFSSTLQNWPIYEVSIVLCLIVSIIPVLKQLKPQALIDRPITVCVLGVLVTAVLSHLWRLNLHAAAQSGVEVLKVVIYYLLLVAVVNTPARLRTFLAWFAIFAAVHMGLAILQQHHVIDIQAFQPVEEETISRANGEVILQYRMCGAGIFHDPNDLAVLGAVTVAIALYQIFDRRFTRNAGWLMGTVLWIAVLGICGYGILLTQSRGGFIAFMAGLAIFLLARFGWKSILIGAVMFPLIVIFFSGRQTDIHMLRRSTAQSRFEFWIKGLELLRDSPIFGIGQGNFRAMVGAVTHNSFLHSYTELGLFGGTLFLGAFFLALWPIYTIAFEKSQVDDSDGAVSRMRPYILGMISAWVVGMLSLSRPYVAPTYMMLGLATAYLTFASPRPRWRFDWRLMLYLFALSVAFLGSVYVVIRVLHRH